MEEPPGPPASLEPEREVKRQRTASGAAAASPVEVPPDAAAAASKPARKKAAPSGVAAELGVRLAAAHEAFLRDREQHRYYHLWDMSTVCPHWLVGRDVRVTLALVDAGVSGKPGDSYPFPGTVHAYNEGEGTHCVSYKDGVEDWVSMPSERVLLLLAAGEVPPPPSREGGPEAAAAPQTAALAAASAEVVAVAAATPPPSGPACVGQRVAVFWPPSGAWRDGVCESWDAHTGMHAIAFDDTAAPEPVPVRLLAPLAEGEAAVLDAETEPSLPVRWAGAGGRRGAALAATPQGLPCWGRVKGYPFWPALAVGDADALYHGKLRPPPPGAPPTLPVQYFGTAEHGRLSVSAKGKEKGASAIALAWADGMAQQLFLGAARDAKLREALAQAEAYLGTGVLPDRMGGAPWPDDAEDLFEDVAADAPPPPGSAAAFWAAGGPHAAEEDPTLPWQLSRELTVERLGRIEFIRPAYHAPRGLFPVGYQALRTLPSGRQFTCEIVDGGEAPLFRVSVVVTGLKEAFKAPAVTVFEAAHPTQAWAKAMAEEPEAAKDAKAAAVAAAAAAAAAVTAAAIDGGGGRKRDRGAAGPSGADMFGLSHKRVVAALQRLPDAPRCEGYQAWEKGVRPKLPPLSTEQARAAAARAALHLRLPPGVTAVQHPPPPDRCAVCNAASEWDDDQLAQCDGCRLLVHQRCYGLAEAPDGTPWLCAACALRLPAPPPCALCPVAGGALKPTTCGRWAHVACAQWVPETSFADPDLVEPIDGVLRISKQRLSLRCGLCRQPHGACVQCAGGAKCYATYHVLCARARGYRMELRDTGLPVAAPAEAAKPGARKRGRPAAKGLDGNAVTGLGDGIFLASFCPRCKPPGGAAPAEGLAMVARQGSTPVKGKGRASGGQARAPTELEAQMAAAAAAAAAASETGCARSVPLDWSLRRLRREPAAQAAFLAKRAFVEATPYIVTGRRHIGPLTPPQGCARPGDWDPHADNPDGADHPASLAERYDRMRASVRQRLTCGKSAIHGWGAFTKTAHAAGDMVIEYAGELVRPSVAELRERRCYDALVGAGTYVFRRDDAASVDATRAGNMAHLINHSCDPNCHSRLITVAKPGGGEQGEALAAAGTRIVLFALRDLPPGVELSYDYRFTSERERLPCNCGTAKCRGFVNLEVREEEEEEAPRAKLPPGWRWASAEELARATPRGA